MQAEAKKEINEWFENCLLYSALRMKFLEIYSNKRSLYSGKHPEQQNERLLQYY